MNDSSPITTRNSAIYCLPNRKLRRQQATSSFEYDAQTAHSSSHSDPTLAAYLDNQYLLSIAPRERVITFPPDTSLPGRSDVTVLEGFFPSQVWSHSETTQSTCPGKLFVSTATDPSEYFVCIAMNVYTQGNGGDESKPCLFWLPGSTAPITVTPTDRYVIAPRNTSVGRKTVSSTDLAELGSKESGSAGCSAWTLEKHPQAGEDGTFHGTFTYYEEILD
jgi:hypothetical protein